MKIKIELEVDTDDEVDKERVERMLELLEKLKEYLDAV